MEEKKNHEIYKKRLKEFNSTLKYVCELEFLKLLLDVQKDDTVLDYGCGNGTAVKFMQKNTAGKIYGYDKVYFSDEVSNGWFIENINKRYNKIYFMHSLAHINNPEKIISSLKENINSRGIITVITPNKEFDEYFKKNIKSSSYIPDDTVVKHFNSKDLEDLFLSQGYEVTNLGQFGKYVDKGIHERLFIMAKVKQ